MTEVSSSLLVMVNERVLSAYADSPDAQFVIGPMLYRQELSALIRKCLRDKTEVWLRRYGDRSFVRILKDRICGV